MYLDARGNGDDLVILAADYRRGRGRTDRRRRGWAHMGRRRADQIGGRAGGRRGLSDAL